MTPKHWLYVVLHALVVMLGMFVARSTSAIQQAIGGSLIATGISGWIIFLYVFVSSATAERLALVESAGLKEVFPFRSVNIRQKYEERLEKARAQIDIIGFGLRSLREDFERDFDAWAARARVRVLIIDPDFPSTEHSLATMRDLEEGNARDSIRQDARAFVRSAANLRNADRFQVRLYRTIPAINYFRIDNEAFWGPYLLGVQSRNTPTLLIGRTGTLFTPLAAHFEAMWSDERFSRAVPGAWVSQA